MKRSKYIQAVLILVWVIAGSCSSSKNNQPTSFLVMSPTSGEDIISPIAESTTLSPTPSLIPVSSTITSTPTVIPLPTATYTMTLTSPPTLPRDKAQEIVSLMLKSNGGCKLPCWWGIKPGVSTWEETANALSPFVSKIETYQLDGGLDANGNIQPEFVAIIHYLNNNDSKSLQLTAQDGVIDSIDVYDDTSSYRLSVLIRSFGDPPFIYVNTVHTSPSGTVRFLLVIYYPDEGIIAAYNTESDAPIQGKNVVFCAKDIAPMMLLWSSKQDVNDQYQKRFLESLDYWVTDGGLFQIEEVNDSPKSTIYANLRETGCINVSVELWEKVYHRNKP